MNIVIPIQFVPDLVEELLIDVTGATLDRDWVRWILNEFDDHAIEQGILMQERGGGNVIVLAPDFEGGEDVLFTSAAKGANRLVKISGDFEDKTSSHTLAAAFASVIQDLDPGLVLTGVQAHTDIDGQVGPLLAEQLELPYIGYISGVTVQGEKAIVRKEYPGGVIAELEVALPAVLGVQSAEKPPRYVAFSKVRQVMKTAPIEERMIDPLEVGLSPEIIRIFKPEGGTRATMLEGGFETIATNLLDVFKDIGVL